MFEGQGVAADIRAVPHDQLGPVIRAALDGSVDAVVAGGGDGTVNAVAAHLIGTGFPLGILPLGTFNHFAKDLGIPAELEAAMKIIARGFTRAVDVGEVNGQIFLNNSSIGAYPQALKERDLERRLRGRPKPVAMLIALLRVFRLRPLHRIRVTHGAQSYVTRTPFLFVGNNEYENLLKESKRPRLDGGVLCVFTAKSTGIRCLVRLLWASMLNRLANSRDFEYRSVSEVKIDPHQRTVNVARDGEVTLMDSPLHYRVKSEALRVLVPEACPR
jgi:diacylglycerol kinase family enzyme